MSEDEGVRSPLGRVPAPDLWPRIEQGLSEPAEPDGGPPRRPGHRQRVLAAAVALVVVAGGIAFAWAAFGDRFRHATVGPPPPTSPRPLPSAPAITVGAAFHGADARCEATLRTPVVRPGQTPGVLFRLTNEGAAPIRYGTYQDYFEVKDGHGGTVSEWVDRFEGIPPPLPAPMPDRSLKGGASTTFSATDMPVVRWEGSLSIHLTCPFVIGHLQGNELHMLASPTLPPLPLEVVASAPAPAVGVAVDRAVAATRGLFDSCRPRGDGSPVNGEIRPPKVARPWKIVPDPMRARCWAQIERHSGFDVVTLWFVTPPNVPAPTLSGSTGSTGSIQLPAIPTAEVFRWTIVVTPSSTVPSLSHTNGKSATPTVGYDFENDHWTTSDASCSASSYGGGGVEFPVSTNPC